MESNILPADTTIVPIFLDSAIVIRHMFAVTNLLAKVIMDPFVCYDAGDCDCFDVVVEVGLFES